MCMHFSAVALVGFASFLALVRCLTLKPQDVSEDSALPKKVAWFHPPKLGTSFGNVLAHAANASLPECARISTCSVDPSLPKDKKFSLEHPFEPHRCIDVSDGFMVRYPEKIWFRSTTWWNHEWRWGTHEKVDASSFAAYSFYGLFRPPHRQLPSNYFRMLDFLQDPGTPINFLQDPGKCLEFLGVNEEDLTALRNFSNSSPGLNALLTYAQSRQGFVTKMLAGVGEAKDAGCPGPDPAHAQPENFDVAVAIERLQGFHFVGLTDDWERSVCLFHRMHGDRLCTPAEFDNNRKTATDADTDFEGLFREHGFTDQADQKLFEAARERFERDVKLWDVNDAACERLKCTFHAHQNSMCSSD